jgi:hypothetical protein
MVYSIDRNKYAIDTGDEINTIWKSFKIMETKTSAILSKAKPDKNDVRSFNSATLKHRANQVTLDALTAKGS